MEFLFKGLSGYKTFNDPLYSGCCFGFFESLPSGAERSGTTQLTLMAADAKALRNLGGLDVCVRLGS